jgi:exonuclease III
VRLVKAFNFSFTNEYVGQKRLFDRLPLVGYFQALKDGSDTNDFLLVNVHLTSGQNNDENHLAAMVIIEQNIKNHLKREGIKESDKIVLGDFNDNQFAKKMMARQSISICSTSTWQLRSSPAW